MYLHILPSVLSISYMVSDASFYDIGQQQARFSISQCNHTRARTHTHTRTHCMYITHTLCTYTCIAELLKYQNQKLFVVLVLDDDGGVFTVLQLKLAYKLTELMANDTSKLIMLEINDLIKFHILQTCYLISITLMHLLRK